MEELRELLKNEKVERHFIKKLEKSLKEVIQFRINSSKDVGRKQGLSMLKSLPPLLTGDAQQVGGGDEEQEPICLICFGEMEVGSTITLPCAHTFHTNCIQEWIRLGHNTCPICRTPFGGEEEEDHGHGHGDDDHEVAEVDGGHDEAALEVGEGFGERLWALAMTERNTIAPALMALAIGHWTLGARPMVIFYGGLMGIGFMADLLGLWGEWPEEEREEGRA